MKGPLLLSSSSFLFLLLFLSTSSSSAKAEEEGERKEEPREARKEGEGDNRCPRPDEIAPCQCRTRGPTIQVRYYTYYIPTYYVYTKNQTTVSSLAMSWGLVQACCENFDGVQRETNELELSTFYVVVDMIDARLISS